MLSGQSGILRCLLSAIVLSVSLAACSDSELSNSETVLVEPGKPNTPAQTGAMLALLDADDLDLESLGDRVLFVNYWAVWCKPCIEEMPELAHFRETHHEIAEVLGYNFDAPAIDQLRDDVDRLGVEIPVLLEDPAEQFGFSQVDALPVTWVLYRGETIAPLLGPQTEQSLLGVVSEVVSAVNGVEP